MHVALVVLLVIAFILISVISSWTRRGGVGRWQKAHGGIGMWKKPPRNDTE